MIHRHVPAPPLRDFVDLFWQYDGLSQPHALERVLPTASIQMIINLAEDGVRVYDRRDQQRLQTFSGTVFSGPYSEFFVIDTAQQASMLGVAFKPGGAFPFLGLPAAEVRDAHVSLADLWGADATALREQLLEAETPEERFRLLERGLLSRAASRLMRHPVVTYALNEFRGVPQSRTVTDVTEQVGLSARRFIQIFDQEVGLTPKLYCRVRRFQKALHTIEHQAQADWADLAQVCGYYDQAHLIRDFQQFSGLSPSAYFKQRGQHLNHVPLPA